MLQECEGFLMDVPIIVVAVCKRYLGAASRQPDQLSQHAAENVIAGVHSVEHCAKARVEKKPRAQGVFGCSWKGVLLWPNVTNFRMKHKCGRGFLHFIHTRGRSPSGDRLMLGTENGFPEYARTTSVGGVVNWSTNFGHRCRSAACRHLGARSA